MMRGTPANIMCSPWIAILVLALTIQHSYAQSWVSPYFAEPDQPQNGNVDFPNGYNGGTVVSGIYFDENVPDGTPVNIATVTYTGSDPPVLTANGGGDPLGLQTEKITSTGEWRVLVTKQQDAETTTSFSVEVKCGSTTGFMNLVVRNLNDEAPFIEAPTSCNVLETHPIDTVIPNCVITINDRDGVAFGGSVMELSVISANGSAEFDLVIVTQTEETLETALVIRNNMLDYESIKLHFLTLVAKNGDNTSLEATKELLLQVGDVPDQPRE